MKIILPFLIALLFCAAGFIVRADDQPTLPDTAWEPCSEGVAFAMTLTEQTENGAPKGTLHFYLKNTSGTDKSTLQDNNNYGCIFFVLYLNDQKAPFPLRLPPPILMDRKDTVVLIKPGEILSRTMDLSPDELALVKTHAVQCSFGVGAPPVNQWSWLKSSPKLLSVTP